MLRLLDAGQSVGHGDARQVAEHRSEQTLAADLVAGQRAVQGLEGANRVCVLAEEGAVARNLVQARRALRRVLLTLLLVQRLRLLVVQQHVLKLKGVAAQAVQAFVRLCNLSFHLRRFANPAMLNVQLCTPLQARDGIEGRGATVHLCCLRQTPRSLHVRPELRHAVARETVRLASARCFTGLGEAGGCCEVRVLRILPLVKDAAARRLRQKPLRAPHRRLGLCEQAAAPGDAVRPVLLRVDARPEHVQTHPRRRRGGAAAAAAAAAAASRLHRREESLKSLQAAGVASAGPPCPLMHDSDAHFVSSTIK
eukprot:Rhum_TRINITY_DN12629_c0_g1::Rhum_TRINITY_DN12629_c0_g1_i1::g.53289::m.53289